MRSPDEFGGLMGCLHSSRCGRKPPRSSSFVTVSTLPLFYNLPHSASVVCCLINVSPCLERFYNSRDHYSSDTPESHVPLTSHLPLEPGGLPSAGSAIGRSKESLCLSQKMLSGLFAPPHFLGLRGANFAGIFVPFSSTPTVSGLRHGNSQSPR